MIHSETLPQEVTIKIDMKINSSPASDMGIFVYDIQAGVWKNAYLFGVGYAATPNTALLRDSSNPGGISGPWDTSIGVHHIELNVSSAGGSLMTLKEDGNTLLTWTSNANFIAKETVLSLFGTGSEFANFQLCDSSGCEEPTPPPPPTTKVVVLPGFGASWNADAILNCKTEGYSPEEWELVPIWGAPVYNPIMTALQNAGMTPELFLYDWRRAVASTAGLLKPFIENGLVTGEKKYLVGHSMGGLVGRAYLDQVTTDHQLDKMITVGTPHKGAPKAYPAWSAGQIWEDDLFKRIAFTTILKSCGLRNGQDDRETTQTMIPSVRDLLPTFDYLRDNTTGFFKSVGLMSAQNTWLTGSAFSAPFHGVTMGTLYGNTFETLSGMAVKNRNRHDERLSNWADGKPLEKEFSPNGDGTVLEMSSVLAGADNRTIALNHENLIASTGGILKIFDFLGITPVDLSASSFVEPASALVVIGYPANVWITDPTGKTFKDTQGLVIIANPKPGTYKLKLVPKSLGNIRIIVAQFLEDGRTFWKEYPYRSMLPKFGAINFDPANPQEDALR